MPIARNIYIRQTKLSDVKGRIDYISNPKRQEHLYATYSMISDDAWEHLAEQNQHDFKTSGTKGTCIEARELVIALPESFVEYDPEKLLKVITQRFFQEYGTPCISALHHNKEMTNYHIHLIYSERKLMKEPVRKIATRNMFYDETGKHVRTKKEILDEEGKIRKGCKIIPKGSEYDFRMFEAKEEVFKSKHFIEDVKHMYCNLINQLLPEDKKMTVFDSKGPYLATKKIGKNNPMEDAIREDNKVRQEWNRTVDAAIHAGVPETQVCQMKKELVLVPIQKSIQKTGERAGRFSGTIEQAIRILKDLIERFLFEKIAGAKKRIPVTDEKENQGTMKNADLKSKKQKLQIELNRLESIGQDLNKKYKVVLAIEKKLNQLHEEYDQIKDSLIWHKTELLSEIQLKEKELKKVKEEYLLIPKVHGFKSINDFNMTYKKIKADLESLQSGSENSSGTTIKVENKKQKEPERKSIHTRLEENKEKVKKEKSGNKNTNVRKKNVEEL